MTLTEKIGQRLVGGFPGREMGPDFIRVVKEYKIGNVILFQHNVESNDQLRRLCGDIHALVRRETGHDAFITIDQEGGGVTRLPGEAVNVPGAMALAATGDEESAYRAARLTAAELRAFGINFNLAPVADVNCNPDNPIIGVRSYGDRPEQVERFAAAALRQSTITLVRGELPAIGDSPFFCGCADYRAGLVSNAGEDSATFTGFLSAKLGGTGLVTGKDPGPEEIREAVETARGRSAVFVNTYNGHLFPGQGELVRALGELGIPMAVVALRNPYDLRQTPPHAAAVAAWDYSLPTLEALVPILTGGIKPRGRLPIALERQP